AGPVATTAWVQTGTNASSTARRTLDRRRSRSREPPPGRRAATAAIGDADECDDGSAARCVPPREDLRMNVGPARRAEHQGAPRSLAPFPLQPPRSRLAPAT